MAKTAIITGVTGQDGAYLAKLLLGKGYKVVGGVRRTSLGLSHRLAELGIEKDVEAISFELGELPCIMRVLEKYKPDEFYNLAAQSFVGTSWDQSLYTSDVNAMGVCRILEAIRTCSPHTRFYQASTSEMFGKVSESPQSETTPFYPRSPYGVAKLFGHWMTVNYRESHNLHASSGILFNHESPLRGMEFVTRKISHGLARIALGKQKCIELGNLSSERDWGFAGDYVKGMWQILQQDEGDDYLLATGTTNTIRYFVETAGRGLDMDIVWEGSDSKEIGIDRKTNNIVVKVNPKFYRPSEVELLLGDATKAREKLGWEAKVTIDELIGMMVKADYDRVKHGAVKL